MVKGTLDVHLDTGPPSLTPPSHRVSQGAFTARLLADQLDSINFPRFGDAGTANVFGSRGSLGADDTYTKWDADLFGVYSIGDSTLAFGLKGGGKIGAGDLPVYDQFSWGGFLNQSGYRTNSLYGDGLAFSRVVYYNKLVKQTLLEGLYAGASFEVGKIRHPLVAGSPTGVLKSGAIFVAYDSLVGPLYIGYGHAADGSHSAYFFLGRP